MGAEFDDDMGAKFDDDMGIKFNAWYRREIDDNMKHSNSSKNDNIERDKMEENNNIR